MQGEGKNVVRSGDIESSQVITIAAAGMLKDLLDNAPENSTVLLLPPISLAPGRLLLSSGLFCSIFLIILP